MCTCISTCMHVHLTPNITSKFYGYSIWTHQYFCMALSYMCQSTHLGSHTLFRMCTCISPCTCVHLSPHVWSTTPMDSYMEMWVQPLCHCVCVPLTLLVVTHLVKNVYMHWYMYLCPPGCPCILHPLCIVTCKHG